MSTARAQLAAALGALLPAYTVLPDPRSVGTPDPDKIGTIQVVRAGFRPSSIAPQAQFVERLHVWVLTHLAAQPEAEDDLDERVLEVAAALQSLGRAGWDDAERLTHQEGFHGYRIAATYITDKEQ